MIYDPALGKTKPERAFGNDVLMPGVRTRGSRRKEFTYVARDQYGAPKPSKGRYQVADTASDAINPSIRSYNR